MLSTTGAVARFASRILATVAVFAIVAPAPSVAADDVLARVRARNLVRCAGIVRPGIAVPSPDGRQWSGIAPDVCRAIAAAVLGDPARMSFRPYADGAPNASHDGADDVVFLSGAELLHAPPSTGTAFEPGPTVAHDAIALLVPGAGAGTVSELRDKTICVEPGSPSDRALTRYFAQRSIALHEHPFQETDEMRQAYGDGKCDALAGPLSTLASVRADPEEGRRADRILPESLADDPIFAATSADARWARVVWWTFSTLVDAESAGIGRGDAATTIPGVPPLVGRDLGLSLAWTRDVISAVGNYGELYDRNLGTRSKFHLARGTNALVGSGDGSIYGLSVE